MWRGVKSSSMTRSKCVRRKFQKNVREYRKTLDKNESFLELFKVTNSYIMELSWISSVMDTNESQPYPQNKSQIIKKAWKQVERKERPPAKAQRLAWPPTSQRQLEHGEWIMSLKCLVKITILLVIFLFSDSKFEGGQHRRVFRMKKSCHQLLHCHWK